MAWTSLNASTRRPETQSNDHLHIVAIHAALLPGDGGGEILFYGGPGWGTNISSTPCGIFDLATNQVSFLEGTVPQGNAFCGGHAFLADGRLISVGGQRRAEGPNYHTAVINQAPLEHFAHGGGMQGGGERICWIYHPRRGIWTEAPQLSLAPSEHEESGGRWYPVVVTLADGRIWTTGGHPDVREVYPPTAGFPGTPPTPQDAWTYRHNNNTPELYAAGATKWQRFDDEATAPQTVVSDSYPRFHLLPSGRLFSVTAGLFGAEAAKRQYDPYSGVWVGPDTATPGEGYSPQGSSETSVLLPLLRPAYTPRILTCNGERDYVITVDDAPAWEEVSPARSGPGGGRRNHACATLLPTGDVLLTGGVRGSGDDFTAVNRPMYYRPGIDWQNGDFSAPETTPWIEAGEDAPTMRGYHSVAMLLPDGRVWVAGSTDDDPVVFEHGIDIFDPVYGANRPQLNDDAPDVVGYGMTFEVTSPDAERIARVAFMRCGSVTHAFNFDQRYVAVAFQSLGDRVQIIAPPDGKVAPPGVYMLWIIDDDGRPCTQARFVRLANVRMTWWSQRSTISVHEVEALGGAGAVFEDALMLAFEGFTPTEVDAPVVSVLAPGGAVLEGLRLQHLRGTDDYSVAADALDTAQTIVRTFEIVVEDEDIFDLIPDGEDFAFVTIRAEMGPFTDTAQLMLSRNPNPYMYDGNPPHLSVDLRVFATNPGRSPTANITLGDDGPVDYIRSVLTAYNAAAGDDNHPFDALPTSQSSNHLWLSLNDNDGNPVYNFAVARVRYLAPADLPEVDIKVFFRLWTTGWTGLEYNTSENYRRSGNGANAAPLLGLMNGEITTIPCFASDRNPNMTQQVDPPNTVSLVGQGAVEATSYVGAWLDNNQITPHFVEKPTSDGPFPGADKALQDLMRGTHNCLVAEIHAPFDPILNGASPHQTDNLAQRNILFDDADNPGAISTHMASATLALKPSAISLPIGALAPLAGSYDALYDLLLVDWGRLPRDSLAFLYMPTVAARGLVEFWNAQGFSGGLDVVDDHTVRFRVADISTLPVPSSREGPRPTERAAAIPTLFSVLVPPGSPVGATYRVTFKQIEGRGRRIKGATSFDITVRDTGAILPDLKRNISVLRHIREGMSGQDRWRPVFDRWLGLLDDRWCGFGFDPADITPSPEGVPSPSDGPGPGAGPGDCSPKRPGGGRKPGQGQICGRIVAVRFDDAGCLRSCRLRTDICEEHEIACESHAMAQLLLQICREDIQVCVSVENGCCQSLEVVC